MSKRRAVVLLTATEPSVAPTVIETPMTAHLLAIPAVRAAILEQTPLDRLGQLEDVTRTVLWLTSDDAAFITGVSLLVDGGHSKHLL